jgi:hypothetical protein
MAILRFLTIKYYILVNFERKMVENSELLVFLGDFKKCTIFFKIFVIYRNRPDFGHLFTFTQFYQHQKKI